MHRVLSIFRQEGSLRAAFNQHDGNLQGALPPCRPTDGPCISISYGYCSSSFRMQTYCLDGTASQLAMMANAAACTFVASQAPASTLLVLAQALLLPFAHSLRATLFELCQFPACWVVPPAVRGRSASPVGEGCPNIQATTTTTKKKRSSCMAVPLTVRGRSASPVGVGCLFSCGIAVACLACELFGRRCAVAFASPVGAGMLGTASSLREAERLSDV